MKKISILSLHLGYGGIEKSIVSLANILSNQYDVEIAVCYQLYDKCVFSLDSRIKVKYLNTPDIIPNHKSLKKAISSFHIVKMMNEGFYALKVLHFRKKNMIRYLKKCDSDVIISTRDIFNSWTGKYAKSGIVKIAWEHNHFHDDLHYANKVVNSVKKMDTFVLVTKDLQKYYSERLNNVKCVCIPNCIESLPSKTSSLKEKRLISVGRLSPEKGFLDLLKIYDLFQKKHEDWKLDIIGDGSEMDSLKEYISTHHLENKITLHGFQNKDYIDKMYLKSSIYLMSSFTESFGIVLIEAMSFGIPCIAMDSAEGARDIIQNEKNGFLVSNRSYGGMIQSIEKLILDDSLRKKMGLNARESVKKYTSDIIGKEWFKLIEESDGYER